MFKILIATACVAVIAGLLFMQHEKASERAAEIARYHRCQDGLATFKRAPTDELQTLIVNCRVFGGISPAQWEREVVSASR